MHVIYELCNGCIYATLFLTVRLVLQRNPKRRAISLSLKNEIDYSKNDLIFLNEAINVQKRGLT